LIRQPTRFHHLFERRRQDGRIPELAVVSSRLPDEERSAKMGLELPDLLSDCSRSDAKLWAAVKLRCLAVTTKARKAERGDVKKRANPSLSANYGAKLRQI